MEFICDPWSSRLVITVVQKDLERLTQHDNLIAYLLVTSHTWLYLTCLLGRRTAIIRFLLSFDFGKRRKSVKERDRTRREN